MLRFTSLVLLAACAMDTVFAAPQTGSKSDICAGYMWGVIIDEVHPAPYTIYNQYIETPQCGGPAGVQSSTLADPPASVNLEGIIYECQVPAIQYYCGTALVATCCGNLTTPS